MRILVNAKFMLTFFSAPSTPHLSTTPFNTRLHFDASLISAKSCAGVVLSSLLLYIRDLSEPPALEVLARTEAAS
jgi:hypothetical protein